MRNLGLIFGTMGVIGIVVGLLMSVFIDISTVWFLLPVAMIAMWIVCEIIENRLDDKRNKKRIRSSN